MRPLPTIWERSLTRRNSRYGNQITGLLTLKCHRDDRVPSQSRGMNNLDPLLSAQQLADYLEIPIATLYAWRYRREGPPGFRVGRHLRFRRSDVEAWIEANIDDTRHYQTAQSDH